jgi:hypothetical protein
MVLNFGCDYATLTVSHLPKLFHLLMMLLITIPSLFCDSIFCVSNASPIQRLILENCASTLVLSQLLRAEKLNAILAKKVCDFPMSLSVSLELKKHFKGFCSSPEIIMLFVYMKCRFSLSYRELEEMATIRGVSIDHATIQRWVIKFVQLIDTRVRKRKKPVNRSWRMDETYIKVNG